MSAHIPWYAARASSFATSAAEGELVVLTASLVEGVGGGLGLPLLQLDRAIAPATSRAINATPKRLRRSLQGSEGAGAPGRGTPRPSNGRAASRFTASRSFPALPRFNPRDPDVLGR